MYAQAAVKRNIIPRNGAYRIVNRDVHFCTPPCSSLRSKDYTSLSRITLDTATDAACGSGAFLVKAMRACPSFHLQTSCTLLSSKTSFPCVPLYPYFQLLRRGWNEDHSV